MATKKFGRYVLRKKLGEGGMGVVLQAHDPQTNRDVAVKVLPPQAFAQSESLERFQREVNTIAKLEHPAIVPMYDSGIESSRPYLVMRLMKGGSLADPISKGAMPLPKAIPILKQIASAIDYAHSKSIVHRDIKPTNILFDEDGNAHLADFGIVAYLDGSTQTDLTKTTGSGLGTPDYMSPEQAKATDKLDHRTDIYSLGVVIFEMLTGALPYQADTPMGIAIAHMMEPVPRIATQNKILPAGCDIVIQRTMAKDKTDRYQTASAAVADLKAALQGNPLSMTVLVPPPTQKALPPRRQQTTRRITPPPPESKKRIPWLAIAGVLLLLAIFIMTTLWIGTQLNRSDEVVVMATAEPPTQALAAVVDETSPTDAPAKENAVAPTDAPQPTPDSRLFYDDFENGVRPEWGFTESGVYSINGKLIVEGYAESALQGKDWTDYSITISGFETGRDKNLQIRVREQDRDNYLECRFYTHWSVNYPKPRIAWYKVINGQEQLIPSTYIERGGSTEFRIEIDGNAYRVFVNGERVLHFIENTFEGGGANFQFSGEGQHSIDSIEIRSMR